MRLIETDDWILTDDEKGGVHLSYVQALPTEEEEEEIRKKHGEHADPDEHFKPKTVVLHMVEEDLDDLAGILAAWKALSE